MGVCTILGACLMSITAGYLVAAMTSSSSGYDGRGPALHNTAAVADRAGTPPAGMLGSRLPLAIATLQYSAVEGGE